MRVTVYKLTQICRIALSFFGLKLSETNCGVATGIVDVGFARRRKTLGPCSRFVLVHQKNNKTARQRRQIKQDRAAHADFGH